MWGFCFTKETQKKEKKLAALNNTSGKKIWGGKKIFGFFLDQRGVLAQKVKGKEGDLLGPKAKKKVFCYFFSLIVGVAPVLCSFIRNWEARAELFFSNLMGRRGCPARAPRFTVVENKREMFS